MGWGYTLCAAPCRTGAATTKLVSDDKHTEFAGFVPREIRTQDKTRKDKK